MDNFTYKDEFDNGVTVTEPTADETHPDHLHDTYYGDIPKPPSATKPVSVSHKIPVQLNRYLEKATTHRADTDLHNNHPHYSSYLQNQVGKRVKIYMQVGNKTLEHCGLLKAKDEGYLILHNHNTEILCEINSVKLIQII